MPHWFLYRMTPKERAQKFYTDDMFLPGSGQCFWLVMLHGKFASTNQKHYPDLGGNVSSVLYRHSIWPAPNISGFIAQLVEHHTGIARSRVQTPLKSWIFFQASLCNCINCVHCDDHFFIFITIVQKLYFCACFSGVISGGNQWWHFKMLAIFSVYIIDRLWMHTLSLKKIPLLVQAFLYRPL